MTIRIITDSACDIEPDQAAELGIIVMPLVTIFGEEVFRDGIDLSNHEFFEKLVESDELPKTSQATPAQYHELFQQAVDAGDEAICITLSSTLSGCYQNALIALEDFPNGIHVMDSTTVCLGQRILVEYAVQLRNEGLNAEAIINELEDKKGKIHLLALLDTLEYLRKGGRVSSVAAIAGTLLSIKPVVSVENGTVEVVGKARGSKHGSNLLTKCIEKCNGIRFDMPIALGYSGLSDAMLQKYIKDSTKHYPSLKPEDLPCYCIGSIIGTHAGPGAIGVAFFSE